MVLSLQPGPDGGHAPRAVELPRLPGNTSLLSITLLLRSPPPLQVVRKLEAELDVPRLVRIHWTGCPNSCGQASAGWGGLVEPIAGIEHGGAAEMLRLGIGPFLICPRSSCTPCRPR